MKTCFHKIRIRKKKPLWIAILAAAVFLFAVFASALVWPEASGQKASSSGKLTVDAGNASLGYIRVMGKKSKKRLKLRIVFGKETLTYDLNSNGEYEVFPLQNGSGKYAVTLYEQASGNKYSQAGKVTVNAKMDDEEAAFLCPSQYVNYTQDTKAVGISCELCEGLSGEKEVFAAVCGYVEKNFGYDFIKAATVKSGTMPDIDGCIKTRMGICQDLAAVTVCMLRVQGIHARLVIGYADKAYHAWVTANVDGEEVFYDPTAAIGAIRNVKNYTVERIY